MNFPREFASEHAYFIEEWPKELALIDEEDINNYMMYRALRRYYYEDLKNSAGGALHIVLDDGNMRDSDITFCLEICEATKDFIGEEICHYLSEIPEETREFMSDNEWFFNLYVEDVVSEQLRQNLNGYYTIKRSKEVVEPALISTSTIEVTLKPNRQGTHSFDGIPNYWVTFQGKPVNIPTQTLRFTMEKNQNLNDFLKFDEVESIKII